MPTIELIPFFSFVYGLSHFCQPNHLGVESTLREFQREDSSNCLHSEACVNDELENSVQSFAHLDLSKVVGIWEKEP